MKMPQYFTRRIVPFVIMAGLIGCPFSLTTRTASGAVVEAELPRVYIDTSMPDTSTYTIVNVSPGDGLQAAIDNASCGTVIRLQAGATYTGSFYLRNKNCDGRWIIFSSSAESQLPPGQRVSPSQSNLMAQIVSPNGLNAFTNEPGASFYRFVGLEITTASSWLNNLVYLDSFSPNFSDVPHHIIFDRVYAHGSPAQNVRRAFGFNVREGSVIDSYISDIHQEGFDSQAIGCWGCPGPLKIVNNYLEAATENIAFGGARPSVDGTVPSDIEIRGNHFYKPLSWRSGDPSFAGTTWLAKNLFESKNSRRVLIEGNVLENSWAEAQAGWAFVLPSRTNDGGHYMATQDYTIRNNIIRHVGSGVSILGYDTGDPTWPAGVIQTKRLKIQNNLWEDLNSATWGGFGQILQIIAGVEDLILDHNTIFNTGYGPIGFSNDLVVISKNFVVTNNLMNHPEYGVSGWGVGKLTLDYMTRDYVFTQNVLVDNQWNAVYPEGNYFPSTWNDVLFTNYNNGIGGDYNLTASSPYKNAGTDGKDIGADIPAIMYATRGAVSGVWNADASLSPTSQAFGASGGSGTVSVTSFTGGDWNAFSNSSWISLTSGASGSGNGKASYSVSPNAASSPRAGTLTIAGQTFTVKQDGSEGAGVIAVDRLSIDFGRVRSGETSSQQIKITNRGTGPLNLRGITFLSRTLGIFSREGACDTLAAGESCSLSVKFNPPYKGLFQGIMKIYANASNTRGIQVKLRGTGY